MSTRLGNIIQHEDDHQRSHPATDGRGELALDPERAVEVGDFEANPLHQGVDRGAEAALKPMESGVQRIATELKVLIKKPARNMGSTKSEDVA